MPYGFPSGEGLLRAARRYDAQQLREQVRPLPSIHVPALESALKGTLARSIDAMLETRLDIVDAGKAFMARWLLNCEGRFRDTPDDSDHRWYETLWAACDLGSLEAFRATPLTLLTYNYDRSLEFALARSLQETFRASEIACAEALDCIGPIHLHGQLGILPSFTDSPHLAVPFGGDASQITDDNCSTAARAIKIVHEPTPQDEAFMRARSALGAAERVIFLGFGYARTNVERLLLRDCVQKRTEIYLCVTGFRREQQDTDVRCWFGPWESNLRVGRENEDIVQFFRHFPEALL
jgi:hypothetical protein